MPAKKISKTRACYTAKKNVVSGWRRDVEEGRIKRGKRDEKREKRRETRKRVRKMYRGTTGPEDAKEG